MSNLGAFIAVVASVTAATGCQTWAQGSAPGPREGGMYVVGQTQNSPSIWLCPAVPGKGECRKVTVTEDNK